jgi:signal transduction histidine kinase/ABC-type uncharacterized transport system substrate-binding protein
MRRLSIVLLLMFGAVHAAQTPVPSRPLRVLLLFPSDLLLPWALQRADNTRSSIRAAVPVSVDFFAEGLDALRLPGPDHEAEFVALLLKRYEQIPPDLIVVHGPMEEFVARRRAALWPDVPLMATSGIASPSSTSLYPAGIPGTTVSEDAAGTVELALRLQPDARRVVVVGGSSTYNRQELKQTSEQLERFRDRLDIQYVVDVPPAEIERRLAALPRDSIVFVLPILRDVSGAFTPPQELAARQAAAANAPVYAYYDVAVGLGLLGGSMANWNGQGPMIGKMARELLMGETRVESLRMHAPTPSLCSVDWRQMKRWALPLDRLPEDCQVHFREVGAWEQYRREIIAIALALLFQSALIAALFLQRHRRQVAELELQHQRSQLAHAARLATVGELSASIAHEINQPLAAILTNAEAGDTLIKSGAASMVDMQEILNAIRDDDIRAGEVIQRLRKFLRNEPGEMRQLNANEIVESILRLTSSLARRNGVSVHTALDPAIPLIKGDFVQMQQVLLNLIVNAVDAVGESPPERRRVTINTTERPQGSVEISVADSGPGISAEKLPRIFDQFFTTKRDGMGLGLSISRSIVQSHRGRIWAESDNTGATFRFIIPA